MFMYVVTLIRGIALSVYFGIHSIFSAALFILVNVLFNNRKLDDKVAFNVWAKWFLILAGVEVVVEGAENAPKEGSLILFNHMSFMDILVLYAYMPISFRFGAKIELFSIPVFGYAMKRAGVLPITRHNRGQVLKIYEESIARVKKGESFALAPEGTRQNDPILGRFKQGPFIFAIQAQMPLVPAVLAGAHLVQGKGRALINVGAWKRKIYLKVLPSIPTKGLTLDDVTMLQEKTRAAMLAAHEELHKRLPEMAEFSGTSQTTAST